MKIDRHNYEEYFLLYVDDELSVEQKKQVELFVKENPDLEEELVMLQQSKLIPDTSVVFDKKDLLIKEENNSVINLNNYEQWLVLYVDNELKEEERVAVEKFASAHQHVQRELELFQQTIVPPEKIVFDHKEILFRAEKVRVISMQWWRVAVAAVLIIGAGITLYSILNNRNTVGKTPGVVAVNKKEQRTIPIESASPDKQKQLTPIVKEQEKPQMAAIIPVKRELKKERKQTDNKLLNEEAITASGNQKRSDVIALNSSNNADPQIKNTITFNPKPLFKDSIVTNRPVQTPQPIYASSTDNRENKKFRGFFRKATRIIERTTNINPANDDNKVLIGGMAINLK